MCGYGRGRSELVAERRGSAAKSRLVTDPQPEEPPRAACCCRLGGGPAVDRQAVGRRFE
jgi:hypothetical protein